ncbi:hypothetical protein [Streptomyces vilmorinianum]|uniref:hypothetical protein n=1 Tax=Streptomyces vilmorinianum TaxID=3051092 RepID=UPI0020C7FF7D|nr:hypothetical protein [Streptomyces vilmorinianum]
MLQRLLYALAALPGAAILFGSAVLGAWADDHHHVWISRACVAGAAIGLVVAGSCLLFAMTPRTMRRIVFPHWPEGQDGLFERSQLKLPPPRGSRGLGTAGRGLGVSWGEVALVASVCWLVTGVGYAVFAALDEPGLSVAPLLGFGLVQWVWARHRDLTSALAAAFAGAVILFGLVDVLRPGLGRYVGDALATGFGTTVALIVFTLAGRFRTRTGH